MAKWMGQKDLDVHGNAKRIKELASSPTAVLILAKERIRRERMVDYLLPKDGPRPTRIDAATLSKDAIQALCGRLRTLSLFGNEPSSYAITPVEELSASSATALSDGLTKVTQSSGTLYLVGTSLPASNPLKRALSAQALVLELPSLSPEEIASWLAQELHTLGVISIESGVVEFLAAASDNNLDIAASMCELAALSSDLGTLSLSTVRALFKETVDPNDFKFAELLCGKSPGAAYTYLAEIFAAGKNPFGFLALAHRSLLGLYNVRLLLDSGASSASIAGTLSMPPWLASKQVGLARSVPTERLQRGLEGIARADSLLKNRALNPEDIFGDLVASTFRGVP